MQAPVVFGYKIMYIKNGLSILEIAFFNGAIGQLEAISY